MSTKTASAAATKSLSDAGVVITDSPSMQDIQLVSEGDLAHIAADEAFMNEPVTIRIATSTNKNDPPQVILTVNGAVNRVGLKRGVPTTVKRMHVEVLARMKQVDYEQRPPASSDLESGNVLYSNSVQVYPFQVIKDDNPRGAAWLENILAEPV